MIEKIGTLSVGEVAAFRRDNDQALGLMRGAHREQWNRVMAALREAEGT